MYWDPYFNYDPREEEYIWENYFTADMALENYFDEQLWRECDSINVELQELGHPNFRVTPELDEKTGLLIYHVRTRTGVKFLLNGPLNVFRQSIHRLSEIYSRY